jgi:alpha-D-ribose 1-methylphosphonate 5-triphosphate synthase subunit PhnG
MDKRTLSRISSFAAGEKLRELAAKASEGKTIVILKKPEKTMVLLQIREPVRKSRFYLGEALAVHCLVEVGGVKGAAVLLGDDLSRVEAAAVLDAAHTGNFPGFPGVEKELLKLEKARREGMAREAALFRETQVSFQSMEDRNL